MLAFQFHHGRIYFPKLAVWLDPREPQNGVERVFVSHAHSDHIGEHREVILSAPTAAFVQARLGGARQEHVLPLGEPAAFETQGIRWQI
ncbi:MAG: hypothetical protein DME23_25860, partial [Verrucomicrobia bacterium]